MSSYDGCQRAINMEDKYLGGKELVINLVAKNKNNTVNTSLKQKDKKEGKK